MNEDPVRAQIFYVLLDGLCSIPVIADQLYISREEARRHVVIMFHRRVIAPAAVIEEPRERLVIDNVFWQPTEHAFHAYQHAGCNGCNIRARYVARLKAARDAHASDPLPRGSWR